jgi:hypothetical protein
MKTKSILIQYTEKPFVENMRLSDIFGMDDTEYRSLIKRLYSDFILDSDENTFSVDYIVSIMDKLPGNFIVTCTLLHLVKLFKKERDNLVGIFHLAHGDFEVATDIMKAAGLPRAEELAKKIGEVE